MGMFLWCLFGLVAGYFARPVMPGPIAGGPLVSIAVGIGAALVGGAFGAWLIQRSPFLEVDFGSLCAAIAATLFVLLAYRGYALRWET